VGFAAWVYFFLLVFLFCAADFLWKSGDFLVRPDPPVEHVRWAAILAGEGRDMERSEAAANLFQEGRFDSLILSGPRIFKTHHESEFSEEFLLSKGIPRNRLFQLPNESTSTREEADFLIRQARLLGVDTLLIITSNFHTARAKRIYRKLAGGYPVVRVYASETSYFDPKAWWASRLARETWLIEWIKTANSAWEAWHQKPLVGAAEFMLLEPNPRAGETPKPETPRLPAPDSTAHVSADSATAAPSHVSPQAPDSAVLPSAPVTPPKSVVKDSAAAKVDTTARVKVRHATAKPKSKSKKN
jgi:uncharacterized SAM-binding protein YcdF (DUF218 family)